MKFVIQDQHLFYRYKGKTEILRRVLDEKDAQQRALHGAHTELSHNGREATYALLKHRYYWPRMYEETCTFNLRLFDRWFIDTTRMPDEDGIKEIVMDDGLENRAKTLKFLEDRGIKKVTISAYHPGSNGAVERSMRTLKDALSKMTGGYPNRNTAIPSRRWRPHFHAALMADRVTVNATTGLSPYYFLFGVHAVLPIELELPTWSTLPWDTVQDRASLIAMRARQIQRREKDLEEAILRMNRLKDSNASYFDDHRRTRDVPLKKDDYVLLHDSQRSSDMTSVQKLRFRWMGPYQIESVKGNGSYSIKELDGTVLYHVGDKNADAVNGDRLKRFYPRGIGDLNEPEAELQLQGQQVATIQDALQVLRSCDKSTAYLLATQLFDKLVDYHGHVEHAISSLYKFVDDEELWQEEHADFQRRWREAQRIQARRDQNEQYIAGVKQKAISAWGENQANAFFEHLASRSMVEQASKFLRSGLSYDDVRLSTNNEVLSSI
ncbi:hypothetical protein N7499_006331 [Penicillium canescens]|nr:hypothetical protein N7499_006331 [Penicillium canescens]KAJ6176746.1 hypothetical protein N7485_003660 [Penicillium canescens]